MSTKSKARNEKKSKQLRDKIRTLYVYYGHSIHKIVEILNEEQPNDKVSWHGVWYHVQKIQKEMEHSILPDALDRYAHEFVRLQSTLDGEIENLEKLETVLDLTQKGDKELKLKIETQKHNVRMDKMRMLQDIELPIVIKKLKKDRQIQLRTIPEEEVHVPMELIDERTSEQRDSQANT